MKIFDWLDNQNIFVELAVIFVVISIIIFLYFAILYPLLSAPQKHKQPPHEKRAGKKPQPAAPHPELMPPKPHPAAQLQGPETQINMGDSGIINDIAPNKPHDDIEANVHHN